MFPNTCIQYLCLENWNNNPTQKEEYDTMKKSKTVIKNKNGKTKKIDPPTLDLYTAHLQRFRIHLDEKDHDNLGIDDRDELEAYTE